MSTTKQMKIIEHILALLLLCILIVESNQASSTTKKPKSSVSELIMPKLVMSEAVIPESKPEAKITSLKLERYSWPYPSEIKPTLDGDPEVIYKDYLPHIKSSLEEIWNYLNHNYQPYKNGQPKHATYPSEAPLLVADFPVHPSPRIKQVRPKFDKQV